MTYVTPHVDIQQEAGWNHLVGGRWVRPTKGPLYMDPFPLSDAQFLVAYNPDKKWNDVRAYGLYQIDEAGRHELIYKDPEFSCWLPTPLRPRKRPPCCRPTATPNRSPGVAADPPLALKGPPVRPQPQPGDKTAARPLHYATDVQPVLDRR